ncbi:unnamed protein product [Toxocara canis]|uniref:Uncharacterized protein n=1 Tax=Toxocara canis TaxID=6265 RepID=A0A183V1E4_TOXCA|nr:unnamed protein product [Toxocara canis]
MWRSDKRSNCEQRSGEKRWKSLNKRRNIMRGKQLDAGSSVKYNTLLGEWRTTREIANALLSNDTSGASTSSADLCCQQFRFETRTYRDAYGVHRVSVAPRVTDVRCCACAAAAAVRAVLDSVQEESIRRAARAYVRARVAATCSWCQ